MKRTASIELDEKFEYTCDVTKSWTASDGRRHIRGVASGVEEDRDGERCSKRAIAKMAAQPVGGGKVKLTASAHNEDWLYDIGEVVKLAHDPGTDELLIEAALPPEGTDPIADKAWRTTASGTRVGFSIGGKLRKAYFELVDTAKSAGAGARARQRKVLDDIELRHVTLTSRPSYRGTFAEAVAKTAPDEPTGDIEWVDEPADRELEDAAKITADADTDARVAKAAPPKPDPDPPAASGTADHQDGNPNLPMARHLACPSCGHEFAAPPAAATSGEPTDPAGQTRKTEEDSAVGATEDTLEKIRALADEPQVTAKTEPADTPAEPHVAKTDEPAPDTEVAKTDADIDEPSDVEKLVAASHRHLDGRVDEIAKSLQTLPDTLGQIAKAVQTLDERIRAMPQGRKSVARVLPHHGEVEKTATETDQIAKAVNDADNAVDALKHLNAARGIK